MNIKELQKKLKADTWILSILIIICGVIVLYHLGGIQEYALKDKAAFEVKLSPTDTLNNTQNNYLFIDGESCYPVDYNSYGRLDANGETNVKANVIIDKVNGLLKAMLIGCILVVLQSILLKIKKGETPFSKSNVWKLRVMAIITFIIALLPAIIQCVSSVVIFDYVDFDFSSLNYFVLIVGVVFGIISEIFRYGGAIQEDIDQIA